VNWNLGSTSTLEVEPNPSSHFFTGEIPPEIKNLQKK
jgi:hypothetical protein